MPNRANEDTLDAGDHRYVKRVTAPSGVTFVGRRQELVELGRAFADAAAGKTIVVALIGDVGIGKSRLAHEFAERRANDASRFATGHCIEHLRAPYLPLSEAARQLGLDTRALFLDDMGTGGESRGPQREKQLRRVAHLAESIRTRCDEKPTLLLLEDIHWADAATLGFIDHIASARTLGATLILLTARTEELERGGRVARLLAKLRNVGGEVIRLQPMGNTEMSTLVRGISAGSLAHPTVERIKTLADGNPLIAEELTRSTLGDQGAMPALIGASIQKTVLDRLYRLSESDQQILACAAVIGRFFDAHELSTLAQRKLDQTFSALRRARLVQLVEELPEHSAHGMMFRHAAFAEIIHRELLRPEARRLHSRYVTMLERSDIDARLVELAYHSAAAHDADKSLHYNVRAGDAAMSINAFEDAGRFYDTAHEIVTDDPRLRATIAEKRAYAWWAAGVSDRTEGHFADALAAYEAIGDTEKVVDMHLYLSRQAWNDAASPSGLDHALIAADLTAQHSPMQHTFAMTMAATHAVHLGQPERAMELLRATPSPGPSAHAVIARRFDTESLVFARQGDAERAHDLSRRARNEARISGDTDTIVRICTNAADLEASLGQVECSIGLWREAYDAAKNGGFVGRQLYASLGYARALIDAGRLEDAHPLYENVIPVGILNASIAIQFGAADALLRALKTIETPQLVDEQSIFELAIRTKESVRIGQLGSALAFASLLRGDISSARITLKRAIEALPGAHFAEDLLLLGALFGDLALQTRAHKSLGELARDPKFRLARLSLLIVNAQSLRGAPRRAALKNSIALALDALRPLYAAAIALAENQEGVLREVLAGIDATVPTAQRNVARSRIDALTPREYEVAQMLAQEASNRVIAVHFGISERTVEHHVQSILGRLGVRSRWLVTSTLLGGIPSDI